MQNELLYCDFTSPKTLQTYTNILQKQQDKFDYQQYLIALVLYKESRGLPLKLKMAFAATIQNRIKRENYRNKTIYSIVTDENFYPNVCKKFSNCNMTNPEFALCSRLAGRVLRGSFDAPIYDATFFHHEKEFPALAHAKGHIAQINEYLFYRI
ncbi:MAG: cell wall hydrolase [Rickettsiales bacterium]|jgi:hypothetical protein|nr:cell wall hydrolase [Rickettsiales bacterium]